MSFLSRRRAGLPEDWRAQAAELVTWFDPMVTEEQDRIGELAERFLTEKDWEAANGFALTEEIRLTISLQAALLVLGLTFEHYRMVKTIIVHPTTMVWTGERWAGAGLVSDGPVALLGQASHHRGPVVIAWDEAHRNARHPERGHDVVLHELAHKLDMLDHIVDGTPPLASKAEHDRWVRVCTAEFAAIRSGDNGDLIWDYAGQDPGEFFAVVTEVFFGRPKDLRHHNAELYEILQDFYCQDPAAVG